MKSSIHHPHVLFLDLGASLSKGIFADQHGYEQLLRLGSEVSGPLTLSQIEHYQNLNPHARPEAAAWLKRGQERRAVGSLAQNFGADTGLKERKEQRAVDKILAAIGVMAEHLDLLHPKGFQALPISLRLGVALPLDEFASRADLSQALQAATAFEFRGTALKLDLVRECRFLPEGAGLWRARVADLKARGLNPNDRTIIVIMLGHRNASVLVFKQEHIQPGASSSKGPGFSEAVHQGFQTRAFQETDQPKLFQALVSGHTKVVLTGDAAPTDLSAAVAVGLDAYWSRLERFLRLHLSPELDAQTELVVSGGAACVMRPRLHQIFDQWEIPSSRLCFYQNAALEQLLRLHQVAPDALPLWVSRMGDAYAGYKGLVANMQKLAA